MAYILENTEEFKRLEKQAQQSHYSLFEELKFLNLKAGYKVLDAGCGSGLLSRHLLSRQRDLEVHACDQSDIRLQQAKEVSKGFNINYFKTSLDSIDVQPESFDVVVCRFVYEYLKNPLEVSREFHRILKPGGIVYLIDLDGVFLNFWTTNNKLNHYVELLRNELDVDLYVGRKLASILVSSQFKDVKSKVSLHHFSTALELADERQNNSDRIIFAKESLLGILGGEAAYQDFRETYLNEMQSVGSTMFFNKFVVWGEK